jgi:hypothetical protein
MSIKNLLLKIALISTTFFIGGLVLIPGHAFVHPDYHDNILQEGLINGINIQFSDILYSMQPRAPGEFRPRFLAYLIITFDQKIRLLVQQYFYIPPVFSLLNLLLSLIIAPIMLYKLVFNLTSSKTAALSSILVFVTSIGYLSGFGMLLIFGKFLAGLVYISVLYLSSCFSKHQLLIDTPGVKKYIILIVLLIGLFFDEMSLYAFILLPIFFPYLFIDRIQKFNRVFFINFLFFLSPFILFLIFVSVVYPLVWKHFFNTEFHYFQNTFAFGTYKYGAQSIFVGPNGHFGLMQIFENFVNLVGLSTVPHYLTGFAESPFGEYPGSQITNLYQISIVVSFILFVIIVIAKDRSSTLLVKATLNLIIFIIFLSLVNVRQFPIVTGYYYGCQFSVFFSLLIATLVNSKLLELFLFRNLIISVVMYVSLTQITNFIPIHEGWMRMHNDLIARKRYESRYSFNDKKVDYNELLLIRSAWKRNELDQYLKNNSISSGALYLIVELNTLTKYLEKK